MEGGAVMELTLIENIRKNAADRVKNICSQYGLYGNVIYYNPSPIPDSNLNRLYVVAGLDPALALDPPPKYVRPDEIVRQNNRNEKLFYPNIWAYDLFSEGMGIEINHALVEYCKTAEFVSNLYAEYDLKPPDKLRISEIGQLINFRKGMENPLATADLIQQYQKGLDWYFKREKTTNTFRRQWLDYFRSEKFPDDKGPVDKLIGYFRRNENKTTVDQMMEVNSDLRKLQMQEHEFKLFDQFMKDCYPEVIYAVGDKEIVDHGSTNNIKDPKNPFGRCVTGEEYAVIRKDRFAEEGFEALSDLRMTYWEFRDIYYKAVDEPLVASVYNSIVLNYAKCNSMAELKEFGPVQMQKIPADDFMNFVSLAKANNVRFYIDHHGDYALPSLDTIHVLYNEHQEGKINSILERMINDKIEYSHMIDRSSHPALSSMIQSIDQIQNPNENIGHSVTSYSER